MSNKMKLFFEIFVAYHAFYIPFFFFFSGIDVLHTVFNPYMQVPNLPLMLILITTIISMLLICILHIFNYKFNLPKMTKKGKIIQFGVMLYCIIYNIALFNFGTLFLGMTIPMIFDTYYASKYMGFDFINFLSAWMLPLFIFIIILIVGYWVIVHCSKIGFVEDVKDAEDKVEPDCDCIVE